MHDHREILTGAAGLRDDRAGGAITTTRQPDDGGEAASSVPKT
jgi:hypothetical protein